MHIQENIMKEFLDGKLEAEQLLEVLEHMEICDYCAEALTTISDAQTLNAPRYLKDQIINRTQMVDIQAVEQIKKTSKKMSLLLYTLRTTTAVAGALLILFAVGRMENYEMHKPLELTSEVSARLSKGSDQAVSFINDFTNQIINGGIKK